MRPEVASGQKEKGKSQKSDFTDSGIPEEWVEPLQQLGYDTNDKLKEVDRAGKLHQEMMGNRKKNKLKIHAVTLEQVSVWLS